MKKSIHIIIFLLAPALLMGQKGGIPLKLGFGLAGFTYTGDFTEENGNIQRYSPGGNVSLQFAGRKSLQFQLNAGFGKFTEQNDGPVFIPMGDIVPNDFVETSFFYTDIRLRYIFLRNLPVRPFLGVGTGLLFFSPRDQDGNYLGEDIFSRLEEEVYLTTIGNFPLSAGIDVRLSYRLGLGVEYIHRITPSDYLDNIGKLGPKEGNDLLRSFQFSIYLSLGQEIENESLKQASKISLPRKEPIGQPEPDAKSKPTPGLRLTPIRTPPHKVKRRN